MSARSKIAKSLHVGAYAPVVFQPSATGENIKRAVTELGLTGVTICGVVDVHADEPPAPKPQPKLPPGTPDALPGEFINVQETGGFWFVDWVMPNCITTLGRASTERGAMSFAKSRALRLGLIVHQGAYVWEAAA